MITTLLIINVLVVASYGREIVCPPHGLLIIPHPAVYGKFLQCKDGVGVATPCPQGLQYNDNDKFCYDPANMKLNPVPISSKVTKHHYDCPGCNPKPPCHGHGCHQKPPCQGNDCHPKPCHGNDCYQKPPCSGNDCYPKPPCHGHGCHQKPPCQGNDCHPKPCHGNDCYQKPPCQGNDCHPKPCHGNDCYQKPPCQGNYCHPKPCHGNDCYQKPPCSGNDCHLKPPCHGHECHPKPQCQGNDCSCNDCGPVIPLKCSGYPNYPWYPGYGFPVGTCPVCYDECNAKLADSQDCTVYYVCEYGCPIWNRCPNGMYFNINSNQCESNNTWNKSNTIAK